MIDITFNSNIAIIENLPSYICDLFQYKFLIYLDENSTSSFEGVIPFTNNYDNVFSLLKKENDKVIVPTGFLIYICTKLKSLGLLYTINREVHNTNLSKLDYIEGLRYYQINAVNKALKFKRGVLQLPTRSGKSRIIAEFIRQFNKGTNILVIVPTLDLLNQLSKDIIDYFKLNNETISLGKIGDGNFNIDNITVSTINSLYNGVKNNKPEILHLLDNTNVVVLDEVHNYINFSGITVLSSIKNAEYKIGLTATAIVDNPYMMEGYVGPTIYKIEPEELIQLGIIKRPHVGFIEVPEKYVAPKLLEQPYSNWVYNQLYNKLIVEHEERNKIIVDISKWIIELEKGPVLILVKKVNTTSNKTVAHSELLQKLLLEKGINLPIIHGNTKDRDKLLQDLRDSKLKGAIASVKILSEGVTIPSLFSIIIGCAGAKEKDFIQRCGRTLACKNDTPLIVDFKDKQSFFSGQSYKRMQYAEENYNNSVKVFKTIENLKQLY